MAKQYKYEMRKLKAKDVFSMSKILKKMDLKGKLARTEGQTQEEFGQQFFMTILESIGDAEGEFNSFLGELVGLTEEEFANLDMEELFQIFEQFKAQDGIKSFFQLLK